MAAGKPAQSTMFGFTSKGGKGETITGFTPGNNTGPTAHLGNPFGTFTTSEGRTLDAGQVVTQQQKDAYGRVLVSPSSLNRQTPGGVVEGSTLVGYSLSASQNSAPPPENAPAVPATAPQNPAAARTVTTGGDGKSTITYADPAQKKIQNIAAVGSQAGGTGAPAGNFRKPIRRSAPTLVSGSSLGVVGAPNTGNKVLLGA